MNSTSLNHNPLYSIFFNPLETFKSIFENQKKPLLFLTVIGSLWQAISTSLAYRKDTILWSSLATQILISLAIGWIFFYLCSLVIFWSGKVIGGKGTSKNSLVVVTWALTPGILAIALYTLSLLLFGTNVVKESTATGNLSFIRTVMLYTNIGLEIWSLIILINGVMFIHKLSISKAILAVFMPILIVASIFFLISLL